MKKWKTLEKKNRGRGKIFRYDEVRRKSQDSGESGSFDLLRFSNWVNIIAITKKGNFVLAKQYRHGTDRLTLEIPGGAIEPDEEPAIAAARELREETGYTTNENLILIGTVEPNPAFQTNYCYTYLAQNVVKSKDQDLDELEEIEVVELSEAEVKDKLKSGEINHALVVAAFWYYDNQ